MRATAFLLSVLGGFGLLCLAGCGGEPVAVGPDKAQASPQSTMDDIRETLFAESYLPTSRPADQSDTQQPKQAQPVKQASARLTLATYRSVVQQLNGYLAQTPGELKGPQRKPEEVQQLKKLLPGWRDEELQTCPLAPEEVQRLRDMLPLSARDADLKTLLGRTFTQVDANHLDFCFLFRDAGQALRQHLGDNPQELATQAFAWVMRQVDLQPRRRDVGDWPAHDILRRGSGEPEERLRVFLALLAQLQLEGGAITRVEIGYDRQRNEVRRHLPWLAAVLLQGELYLFDPLLGQPVYKDPTQRQIAIWKEVKAQPDLLLRHYAGVAELLQRHAAGQIVLPDALRKLYESQTPRVTKELLEGNLLWLDVSLPAFAPRIAWLQGQLAKELPPGELPVRLHMDWSARLKTYEPVKAVLPVKHWDREDKPGYPLRLLAEYADEEQKAERSATSTRPADLVVPWHLLPLWVRDDRTRTGLYYDLMNDLEKRDYVPGHMNDAQRRLMGPFQNVFFAIRLAPGGHRDQLVRGKPERVVQRILRSEDETDKLLNQLHTRGDPVPDLRDKWGPDLAKIERQITLTTSEYFLKKNANASPVELAGLEADLNLLDRQRKQRWNATELLRQQLAVEWGEPELRELLTYYMALAKTELAWQAEWQQRRRPAGEAPPDGERPALEQWQSALFWHRRYEAMCIPRGSGQFLLAVRRQIGECDAAIARLSK